MNMWDERYENEGFFYGAEPNDFLREQAGAFTSGSEVLCLAEGEGRNAVFLASKGLKVTGVDGSAVGLAKAQQLASQHRVQIETIVADLSEWDLGEARWDAVVSIWAHFPPAMRKQLHPRIVRAIRPGGLFVAEHYHPKQIPYKTGGPPDPTWMLTREELAQDFAGWPEVFGFEGERDVQEGHGHAGLSFVTQAILQKPAAERAY